MFSRLPRAAALLALAAATASATVIVSQTIEEMAASAPVIVRGTVGQIQTRWDEGQRRIWTYAEIRVEERLKGEAPAILLVRQPGGVVGPIGQKVSGAAQFKEGEEAVLFLERAADDPTVFGVWSLAAGKVAFERSKVGELRAVRHLEGLALYQRTPDAKLPRIWSLGQEDLGTPQQLLERVRRAIRAQGVAK
ncbi:MAG: hypothetical protein HYZ28_27180 [Myxococcales bacterium]|nr:hypothetical protein [Myxococcales bacterium]